jgi:hypothetical protein
MHDIGARREHVIDFFAKAREIGGQDGRRYLVIGHRIFTGIEWLAIYTIFTANTAILPG